MPSSKSDKKFLKELKKKEMKRKKLKEKKRNRHRAKSDSSSDSSSDDSDMDLQKEMYPISHYVNDREEMLNQVFSVIKGKKLKSMLPPFLVDLDPSELKGLCLEQLIGMSKKRISCVLAGQEMVESSDTDDDTDINTDDTDIGETGRDSADPRNESGNRSDSDDDMKGVKSVISEDPGAATRLKKTQRINFGKKEVTKVVLSGDRKRGEKRESERRESEREKRETSEGSKGEKGKTLMELLELEMRARAIKALLMKAGKDEGEAETLAIEEALDEQKKKEKDGKKDGIKEEVVKKDRHLRQRDNEEEKEEVADVAGKNKKDESEEEEVPEKVYSSENKAMNKAREALILSENRKLIQDEIKQRKEEEAKFMYEEQVRKEKMEKDKEEREKLIQEVKIMKQKMIESEQEERRKALEKERDKMKKDHLKKEELKQQKDKAKLMNKIKAIKDDEEKEKEMLEEHYKTKMTKKIVERADEDEELILDEDEEQKMRRYRRKEDGADVSDDEVQSGVRSRSRSREEYDRGRSRSRSDTGDRIRKPYSRDQSWSPESHSDNDEKKFKLGGKTRLRKKVADGSDVEDGEVEEVDSDAEDEIDREEDQMQLLEKMKNLRKKISKMEDDKVEDASVAGPTSPQPTSTGRGGRGRGRGPRGRGRGRGRGKAGSGSEEDEWSMKKYDFDAPDMKEFVEGHKPNFVKAPRRVFEKHDGYYSEEDAEEADEADEADEEEAEEEEEEEEKKEVEEQKECENEGADGVTAAGDIESKKQLPDDRNENSPKTANKEVVEEKKVLPKTEMKDNFQRVTRAEWNKMGYKEKKKYLKERRRRKQKETVFIKDDSDNEQLSVEEGEELEELEFSDSEDEKDKGERLAKEALKSYAKAFTKEEHPEDYKLVMRKDVVEAELEDVGDPNYETLEEIELRDKRQKIESKEKEKKDKMREDRLKRMQAFQASSVLREEPEEDVEDEEEMEEDEVIEEMEPDENPFYSSYKEAVENKEELDDPLKEERERVQLQLEEDEKELRKLEEEKQVKNLKESPDAPPAKRQKKDFDKYSGVGIFKTMIDSDKEKIQKELTDGEAKSKVETKLEEEKRKKTAENVLKKSRRRGDPNNPSKEEMDAAQELEQLTWQDRYMKNKRVKDVVSSSKMFSKVKNKLKLEKTEKEQEMAPGLTAEAALEKEQAVKEAAPKPSPKNADLPGMIGSLEEYASLVGKSVGQLAEAKYEPPEVESSDESEGDQAGEEGDLWGAIMGGK
eukprot:GFUD01031643.1.p1 GENE.GFUD01031643.1~~GFUD01031643.1.p1  ORF type:complete len:1246 (+),score=549.28 GFUD01031643.1:40-3777(+)